jgi:hypothetical protein
MLNRIVSLFAVLLVVLLLAAPVAAQDAEVTPAPDVGETSITVEDGGTLVLDQSPAPSLPPEIADELPSRNETLTTVLIVVGGLGGVLLLGALLGLFLLAYNAAPPWAQGLLLSNRAWIEGRVDAGTDLVVAGAKTTRNTFDDSVAAYLDELVDRKVKEWFDARETPADGPPF